MRRADPRQQVLMGLAAAHDVLLLAAIFCAPIFWGSFNTGGLALVAALVGAAGLAAIAGRYAQGRGPARVPNAIHAPAAVFLGISAVSALFSVSWHASLLEVSRLAVGVLLFYLIANRRLLPAVPPHLLAAAFACSVVMVAFIQVPDVPGLMLKLFSVIGIGAVCAAIASQQEESDAPRWWWPLVASAGLVVALYGMREKVAVWRAGDSTWKIFSTFFNPNPLAGFFAMVFPLAASATVADRALWRQLIWGFCALMIAIAILPTYSKGGMVALGAAVVCYGIVMAWPSRIGRRIVGAVSAAVAVGLIASVLAVVLVPPVRAKVASAVGAESASNMFRILTWRGTIDLAASRPLLGVGPGGFKYTYPKHATAGYVEAAHQNYLQVFAEQGALGGIAFLWLMGAVVFTAARGVRRAVDFRARAVAVGGLCSVVALLVHSLLDYDWYIGAIGFAFWLVAGLMAHVAQGRPAGARAGGTARPAGKMEEKRPRVRPRRGRRRARPPAVAQPAAWEEGVRPLPWPSGWVGRALLFAGLGAAFIVWAAWLMCTATAEHMVYRADTMVMSGQADTALKLYRGATRLDPGSADAWERYGLLSGRLAILYEKDERAKRGELEKAKRAISRAMRLEPTNFKRINSMACLHEEAGELREAAEYYDQALDRFPKHTKLLRRRAAVHQRLGEEAEARGMYLWMLELENSEYNRYRALEEVDVDTEYAYAHYELARYALKDYAEGKRQDGREAAVAQLGEALRVITSYFQTAEKTDKMFLMFRRPREYRGEDMRKLEAEVRWRLADAYDQLGRDWEARGERRRARATWPDVERAVGLEEGVGTR